MPEDYTMYRNGDTQEAMFQSQELEDRYEAQANWNEDYETTD